MIGDPFGLGELIWILIIVAITVWVIKGVNDFNRMVDIGVRALIYKKHLGLTTTGYKPRWMPASSGRWTPASELPNEMDEKEQKLNEENKEEESDEGDDDFAVVGL